MSVTAQTILTRVRSQLIDELSTKRWSDDELMRWLSDAQRTVVATDPALGSVTDSVQLSAGSKQTLAAPAWMLLDVIRNMGLDGQTPGRVVTVISRENMDRVDPNWHFSRRSDETQHFTYDPKAPRVFFVYPPSTGANFLEVSRSINPDDFTDLAQEIIVPDLYQTAMFDYVMFRAHQKDTDYAAGNDKAQVYLGLFQAFMSAHTKAQVAESPNRQLGPIDLSDKGDAA